MNRDERIRARAQTAGASMARVLMFVCLTPLYIIGYSMGMVYKWVRLAWAALAEGFEAGSRL